MSFVTMRRLATPKKIAVGTTLAASAAGLAFTAAPAQAAEGSPQAVAQQIIGDDAQYQAFSNIVERESGWDPHATNESSGAYGLVQALPADKMASAGSDWKSNPATQIEWGVDYMNDRYGSPAAAWDFWQANGWY
ncbi:transglycosylase SLT domain-containing protein [Streptomyces sp. NPDC058374]|uniref:aggregation-promoting factor C-terminal-like domain-containing protein n=1 Tax=unclassified Streptomyces TaxID=2593676 RepID=UPI00364A1F1E